MSVYSTAVWLLLYVVTLREKSFGVIFSLLLRIKAARGEAMRRRFSNLVFDSASVTRCSSDVIGTSLPVSPFLSLFPLLSCWVNAHGKLKTESRIPARCGSGRSSELSPLKLVRIHETCENANWRLQQSVNGTRTSSQLHNFQLYFFLSTFGLGYGLCFLVACTSALVMLRIFSFILFFFIHVVLFSLP